MAQKIVIDPVTRIEGHLRIEAEVEGGKVIKAWSSGTLFRGFEIFLKNRDPKDAWYITQRICGVCTYVHNIASVLCVEDAIGIKVPDNARIIRNLILGAQYLHDHPVHFYHLHALDWVDVVSALKADPKKTAILSSNSNNSPKDSESHFKELQKKLQAFVDSGQLGPFANGYWGHPAYKLPPEANLMAVSHYLDALEMQVKIAQMMAIFGAKNPHPQSTIVGGVTCVADLNPEKLGQFKFRLKEANDFIKNVYIPDVLTVAPFYLEWGGIGGQLKNYLVWGAFPLDNSGDPLKQLFPRGAIMNGDLSKIVEVSPEDCTEHVKHSWYKDNGAKNPKIGETIPEYTGLDIENKYSWLKSPRIKDNVMEVGPLSRVLVAYARGNEKAKNLVDSTLQKLNLPATVLFSTLGRTAARALETVYIGEAMEGWLDELIANVKMGNTATYSSYKMPDKAVGIGLTEAPRGALGHWIEIEGEKIKNYQCVVPTTWNGSPRDTNGNPGPYEQALIGTPVADPKQPLELLRTIHSFDPCIACSVHLIDKDGGEIYRFKVS